MKVPLMSALLASAFTVALAQPDTGTVVHTGQATYYNATGDGSCMFGPSPGDLMVCAMNSAEYDTGSVCGASIHITGPVGEVTVRIVDLCPECPRGNVDLSKQAFAKIADTIQGRVAVTWRYVETSVTGPIAYRIKTGSNPWWIGIQVLNHRTPIVKLEALQGGAWMAVPRLDYNYFVDASGLGAGPFTFRVTDLYGQQLTDANIPLSPDLVTPGLANFSSHALAVVRGAAAAAETAGGLRPVLRTKIAKRAANSFLALGQVEVYTTDGRYCGRFDGSGSAPVAGAAAIMVVKPVR